MSRGATAAQPRKYRLGKGKIRICRPADSRTSSHALLCIRHTCKHNKVPGLGLGPRGTAAPAVRRSKAPMFSSSSRSIRILSSWARRTAEGGCLDVVSTDWAYSLFPSMPPCSDGLTYVTRMGPLLRDRILLLQFLCITGIPGSGTGTGPGHGIYRDAAAPYDSGSDIS